MRNHVLSSGQLNNKGFEFRGPSLVQGIALRFELGLLDRVLYVMIFLELLFRILPPDNVLVSQVAVRRRWTLAKKKAWRRGHTRRRRGGSRARLSTSPFVVLFKGLMIIIIIIVRALIITMIVRRSSLNFQLWTSDGAIAGAPHQHDFSSDNDSTQMATASTDFVVVCGRLTARAPNTPRYVAAVVCGWPLIERNLPITHRFVILALYIASLQLPKLFFFFFDFSKNKNYVTIG